MIPAAARSKAWFKDGLIAGIAGSNPVRRHDWVLWVLCCQVEVSASGWSLFQRSPTECAVSECDFETSTKRRPRPTGASEPKKTKIKNTVDFITETQGFTELQVKPVDTILGRFNLSDIPSLLVRCTLQHFLQFSRQPLRLAALEDNLHNWPSFVLRVQPILFHIFRSHTVLSYLRTSQTSSSVRF